MSVILVEEKDDLAVVVVGEQDKFVQPIQKEPISMIPVVIVMELDMKNLVILIIQVK